MQTFQCNVLYATFALLLMLAVQIRLFDTKVCVLGKRVFDRRLPGGVGTFEHTQHTQTQTHKHKHKHAYTAFRINALDF